MEKGWLYKTPLDCVSESGAISLGTKLLVPMKQHGWTVSTRLIYSLTLKLFLFALSMNSIITIENEDG